MQGDALNQTRIATILCLPLTGTLKWAVAAGNVLLRAGETGLERDSVANVSLTFAVDREQFIERTGHLNRRSLDRVLAGIDVVLGR